MYTYICTYVYIYVCILRRSVVAALPYNAHLNYSSLAPAAVLTYNRPASNPIYNSLANYSALTNACY